MTAPGFVPAGSTPFKRIYRNGPFTLVLRALDDPWIPENVVPELRADGCPYAICRPVRDPEDPRHLTVAIDLSGVPALTGMSGADRLRSDLDAAESLADGLKAAIEAGCPGFRVDVEP